MLLFNMIQPARPQINTLFTPLLRLLLCVCLSEQPPCTLCLLDCSLLPPVIIAPAKVFMQSKAVLLEKGQESRRMQQCIKAKTSTTMVCVRFWSAHPGEGCTILPELLYFHHQPDFLLKLSALCLRSISCLAFTSTHDTHTFRFSLSLAYIGVRRPDIKQDVIYFLKGTYEKEFSVG